LRVLVSPPGSEVIVAERLVGDARGAVEKTDREDLSARMRRTLPLRPKDLGEEVMAIRIPSRAQQSKKKRRVLIIDDDPVFSRALTRILDGRGYAVSAAGSGEDAERVIASFPAQVILCDVWLGLSSGVDLVPRLLTSRPKLICVMMTAYADIDTAIDALRQGAYDYLRKPFHPEDLLATLKRCFERIRLEEERTLSAERTRRLLEENRLLAQRSMQIQEEERRVLARELHDEIGQWLTAIQAYSEVIRQVVGDEPPEPVEQGIAAIQSAAGHIYDVVHSMMRRLRSGVLDQLGLAVALGELASAWGAQHPDTRCNLTPIDELPECAEATTVTLYRVVQESLTNVAKHARAATVEIELKVLPPVRSKQAGKGERRLSLRIADDGVGMDTATRRLGLGIIGMRERIMALEGTFSMASEPGKGTVVQVTVPADTE
jgi:two-component system sensor histidine kinase UhpB